MTLFWAKRLRAGALEWKDFGGVCETHELEQMRFSAASVMFV